MSQANVGSLNRSVYSACEHRGKKELEAAAFNITEAMRVDCSGRGKLLEKLYKDTRTILETYK